MNLRHNERLACESSSTLVDVLLAPDGTVETTKGTFIVDAESFADVKAWFDEHAIPMLIDWEHQSIPGYKRDDGLAPAAGWIHSIRYEEGRGIIGKVEWTAKARDAIRNGEYRYLSPALEVDKETRRPKRIVSAGLVNEPAIHGMERVVAKRRKAKVEAYAHGLMDEESMKAMVDAWDKFETSLIEMGLIEEGATYQDIVDTAISRVADAIASVPDGDEEMKDKKPDEVKSDLAELNVIAAKLGLPNDATADVICLAIDKRFASTVPADEYAKLQKRIETLEQTTKSYDAEKLVYKYVDEGRLNPNDVEQMSWARGAAANDPKSFEAMIAKAPQLWKPGRETPTDNPSPTPKSNRETIISQARKDYAGSSLTPFSLKQCVNGSLILENEPPLNEQELAALKGA